MHETDLLTLTDADFDQVLSASRTPVVVDFWADWCPPCGPMARTLAELAPEFDGRLLIAKLNADENPEATRRYRVMSMPTLLFFTAGRLTATLVGLRPKSVLRAALTGSITPYANL